MLDSEQVAKAVLPQLGLWWPNGDVARLHSIADMAGELIEKAQREVEFDKALAAHKHETDPVAIAFRGNVEEQRNLNADFIRGCEELRQYCLDAATSIEVARVRIAAIIVIALFVVGLTAVFGFRSIGRLGEQIRPQVASLLERLRGSLRSHGSPRLATAGRSSRFTGATKVNNEIERTGGNAGRGQLGRKGGEEGPDPRVLLSGYKERVGRDESMYMEELLTNQSIGLRNSTQEERRELASTLSQFAGKLRPGASQSDTMKILSHDPTKYGTDSSYSAVATVQANLYKLAKDIGLIHSNPSEKELVGMAEMLKDLPERTSTLARVIGNLNV